MSKQQTSTFPTASFSDSIARLGAILTSLQGFMVILESKELDTELLDEEMVKIAKALNPDLSDEELQEIAGTEVLTFAFNEAVECTHTLMAAWHADNPPGHEKAEILLRQTEAARSTQHKVNKTDVLNDIPWMLDSGLRYICNDSLIENSPASNAAIGARILACLSLQVNEAIGLQYPSELKEEANHV